MFGEFDGTPLTNKKIDWNLLLPLASSPGYKRWLVEILYFPLPEVFIRIIFTVSKLNIHNIQYAIYNIIYNI